MHPLFRSRGFAGTAAVVVVGTGAWFVTHGHKAVDSGIVAPVTKGRFVVTVTNTGELVAPKFVKITGPANAQQADQYEFKIQSLVKEGTIVKPGDEVAELDRSTIASKMSDVDLALQKAQAQYQSTSLDSALDLSKAREDMRTAALTVQEKQLAKDQTQYEAPSVKRQAELDYEKSVRALHQDSMDLHTKTEQAIAKMQAAGTDLAQQQRKDSIVRAVMANYSVKAPAAGMVIYLRNWEGKEIGVGDQISTWDPTIATLPDLTVMQSVTYVNEIDVRKVAVGDSVTITLDADPTKKLRGTVTEVANAGQQRPNSDAKVFEVKVDIVHPDTTLRPGMTTGNAIQTLEVPNALSIPLEAVMTDNGVPFVYRLAGGHLTRQEIETGAANDDAVIIRRGLDASDHVYLSPPSDAEKLPLARLPGSKAGMPGGTPGRARRCRVAAGPTARRTDATCRPFPNPPPAHGACGCRHTPPSRCAPRWKQWPTTSSAPASPRSASCSVSHRSSRCSPSDAAPSRKSSNRCGCSAPTTCW